MKWIAIVLACSLIAAKPATKPATQPNQVALARDTLVARTAELNAARTALDAAKAKCVEAFRASDEYRKQSEQLKLLQQKLDDAKQNGTPYDKINASSAWNKVRIGLVEKEAKLMKDEPAVIECAKRVKDAEAGLQTAQQSVDAAIAQEAGIFSLHLQQMSPGGVSAK